MSWAISSPGKYSHETESPGAWVCQNFGQAQLHKASNRGWPRDLISFPERWNVWEKFAENILNDLFIFRQINKYRTLAKELFVKFIVNNIIVRLT